MNHVPSFAFVTPVPPALKNRQVIRRRGRYGARFVTASDEARAAQREVEADAAEQLRVEGRRALEFGDRCLRVVIEHHVPSDQIRVEVYDAGPRPPARVKSGRKRDLQNIPEGVLDALQGLLYDNDNQIDELLLRRIR